MNFISEVDFVYCTPEFEAIFGFVAQTFLSMWEKME